MERGANRDAKRRKRFLLSLYPHTTTQREEEEHKGGEIYHTHLDWFSLKNVFKIYRKVQTQNLFLRDFCVWETEEGEMMQRKNPLRGALENEATWIFFTQNPTFISLFFFLTHCDFE